MKYRESYSFSFLPRLSETIELPLQMELAGTAFEICEIDADRRYATGFIETRINNEDLELRQETRTISGDTIPPRIIVPNGLDLHRTVASIVHALSFITDVAIHQARLLSVDELIPETHEDEACLKSFGTKEIHHETRATASIRTFVTADLRQESLDKLMAKETGLALYAQALSQQNAIGMFREFWKVLEAAFRAKDRRLLGYLIGFEPTKQLGFTEEELKSLNLLRGRASHAESSAGMAEITSVNAEVSDRLARLKSLVEQVLLTKRTWGVKSGGVDRLARLAGFNNADGAVVIIRRK